MGRMELPCFDGRKENYDKWATEWEAFAEEVGLSDALGEAIDPNMPDSSASVIEKDAAGKLQVAAVKTNKKAMAYLALAFDNMKLLRFITKAKLDKWPEGEAWKVMQFLTKKYCPDETPVRVGLRKMIVEEEAEEECKEAEEECKEAEDECKEAECEEAEDEGKDEAEENCEEAEDDCKEED
jgi:hypothetical protein